MAYDALRSYLDHLNDLGVTGTSDEIKGCHKDDEEYMTALLIQKSASYLQPSANDIDDEQCLSDMLADYMLRKEVDRGQKILDYLTSRLVKIYLPEIKALFEERRQYDPIYQRELADNRLEVEQHLARIRG